MKQIKKVVTVVTASMLFAANSVQAASVQFNGITDSDAMGVTILVTEKDADLKTLKSEQIVYINQHNVNSDGSFSVKLPLFSESLYSFHTNADSYNLYKPDEKITLYVSAQGDDSNSGISETSPIKTLEKAYSLIDYTEEIIIVDSAEYTDIPVDYEGNLTIKGNSGATLNLPASVSLRGNLTLSNLSLAGTSIMYANGHDLKLDETVTSAEKLTVYGGTNGTAYTGDTNITLLGGQYVGVYGGSNNAVVTGSTNVVLGGNANAGQGIDDQSSNISTCYLVGGGNGENANVTVSTNVTLTGNAVTKYICGVNRNTTNTPPVANVSIEGGSAMNVYGGVGGKTVTNCDIHITMTGGTVEAIFGGCENAAMTGNTYVSLLGGTVARRVYTGCYNDFNGSWSSSYYVTGTTTLTIGPNVTLNQYELLNTANRLDIGVFVGSRIGTAQSGETKNIIYADGSYDAQSGNVKRLHKGSGLEAIADRMLPTHSPNYIIKASAGGKVTGTNTAGTFYIAPDEKKCGLIGDAVYINQNAAVSTGTTTVTFDTNFDIGTVTETVTDTAVNGSVTATANNYTKETEPYMVVAVYDADGKFIGCSMANTVEGTQDYTFEMNKSLEAGKEYTLAVMMMNSTQKPLVNRYTMTIKK